ncbi:HAD family hydrolase [Nocardia sp. NPDC058640]|uniref:HAD family hydrolase n=1 Tax=Nocardia sp. NPDC058640 TaxID=3346571 RepID=UPI003652C8F9
MTGDRGSRLLLLDFDGVIADSVEECLAVTWFADRPSESDVPLAQQFSAVPEVFRARFHQLRPFARTLDDFFVAKADSDYPVRRQSDFDALKATQPETDRQAFTTAATALRHRWRTGQRQQWLDTHTIFDGVAEVLQRYSGDVFVITAKDAESSIEILEHFGLDKHVAGVVGDVSDKGMAARCLSLGRGVAFAEAVFIDDNLTNVARVRSAGIPSRWARWGWTSPEHDAVAAAQEIDSIDLHELDGL